MMTKGALCEAKVGTRHVVIICRAGFIGSHAMDWLLADAHTVVGIDSFDGLISEMVRENPLESLRENCPQPGLRLSGALGRRVETDAFHATNTCGLPQTSGAK